MNGSKPIDTSRPMIANPDGSFSTEETITVESNGRHYLIPTIVGGQRVPESDAIDFAFRNRAWVGEYASAKEAEEAAVARSKQIGKARGLRGEPGNEDLAPSYAEETDGSRLAAESAEMTSWLRRRAPEPAAEPPRPRPAGPPAAPSAAGNVMRSVAELPRQAFGGVEDAVANATSILNPLTDWLNENVADLRIDRVPAPKTTTGRVTRSLSQFLTGFIPALKGMKALGVTNAAASSVGASAIADFLVRDPHEARLSNLWKEAGLPQNILTDYLASDPNDSDTEGRFKSAAESVITGVALEGLLHGARAIRAMKGASKALGADQAAQAELAAMKAQYGELTEQVSRKVFGDVKRPRLEVVSKKVQKAVEATKGMTPDDLIGGRGVVDAGDMSIFVNFRRINAPDDVKAVIADMAEKFSGTIKESQRGTITLKETEALADDLGMTVGELMARRQGQALNAEQLVAARKLWVSSAEHLLQLAQRAADPNAGAIDQFAFRQMLATHHAIQSEVMGARAEAARALGSWRLPVGGAIEQAMQMKDLVEASGGATLTQDLAKRLVILASVGGRGAVAKFVEKGAWATSVDALREVWINGLLSSPSTHIVNSLSNTANLAQQMVERNVAARIGELRGVQNVAPGEASAMAFGVIQSVRDAFRLAAKAFRSGEQTALGKIDLPREPAISAQAFRMSDGMMGRFVDLIGHAARIPGRFLMAEDEFFKTIGYRMELNANAVRQATSEGLRGPAFTARVANLIAHPPENLRIAATDGALYSTFNQAPGKIGHAIMRLREAAPASTLVMPFVRTPVNIARYTFERSPFAPLVGQWKADIAAGGARADIALARMSTGTAIMLTAMDMADSGMISGRGPVDPGERQAWERQGNQQYSRKVGDKWVSYNRADPYGALFGFAADVAQIVRRGELQEDDVDEWNEVVAMGIAAVSQVALNKTYLRGMSELVSAMADPTRKADRELTSIFTSFIPATALMGAVERAVDPTVRETNSPWEAIQARVAFLSSRLPPRRDLWGREVRAESGLGATYDMFTPAQTRTMRPEPIDVEIERLAPEAAGDNQPGSAPTKIGKRSSFMGVMVNFKEFPEVYDTYVRLAGNELHHPAFGKGAKDLLNDIVTGQSPLSKTYAMRSPPMRLLFINHVIGQYRALAQQAIMQDPQFRDFANHVERIRAEKMQQRMPVLQ